MYQAIAGWLVSGRYSCKIGREREKKTWLARDHFVSAHYSTSSSLSLSNHDFFIGFYGIEI